LLTKDGTPKPAFRAFIDMQSLLALPSRQVTPQ
jgi:hypothetical protein